MIFLEGVLDNGSDLALPANLTQDRRALLASTPMYDKPLLAGNHSVLVSLNGQQLSAKLASQDAVVMSLSCKQRVKIKTECHRRISTCHQSRA